MSVTKGLLRDLVEVLVLAGGLYLLATTTIQTVHVVGLSMLPSLNDGDLLIAGKLDYRFTDPQRGDIVILKDPVDPSRDFIKRVVGVPGDHILIRDRHVIVNGDILSEPYLGGWSLTANWPQRSDLPGGVLVPPNSYFVLGDNRDHSSDSRLFGFVSRDKIDARALVRIWPVDHAALFTVKPTLAASQ